MVLFNLGGPDQISSVRPFLFNLFNDKAIIDLPRPIRWLVAQLISRRRTLVAQNIYSKLGGSSPLLSETKKQAAAIEQKLGEDWRVFVCMRYWHPFSIEIAQAVKQYNPDQIVLLPLYPQYSTATTASALADWNYAIQKVGLQKPTEVIGCYPTLKGFIRAHSHLLRIALAESRYEMTDQRVLFSAHGLPVKVISSGDPYQWQVEETASAIVKDLNVERLDWQGCYQSRVGPLEWIGPSTEDEIVRAGSEGKSLIVVPVAFVSEHSETLVELDIDYKSLADASGVPSYNRVPALGVTTEFITALSDMACDNRQRGCNGVKGNQICPKQYHRCGCLGFQTLVNH